MERQIGEYFSKMTVKQFGVFVRDHIEIQGKKCLKDICKLSTVGSQKRKRIIIDPIPCLYNIEDVKKQIQTII